MIQSRRCACFAAETLKSLRISGEFLREKLQGHKPTKLGIFRLIHNTHTATAELLYNAVVRNGPADHRREYYVAKADTSMQPKRSFLEGMAWKRSPPAS
jgi:hypothetical protein